MNGTRVENVAPFEFGPFPSDFQSRDVVRRFRDAIRMRDGPTDESAYKLLVASFVRADSVLHELAIQHRLLPAQVETAKSFAKAQSDVLTHTQWAEIISHLADVPEIADHIPQPIYDALAEVGPIECPGGSAAEGTRVLGVRLGPTHTAGEAGSRHWWTEPGAGNWVTLELSHPLPAGTTIQVRRSPRRSGRLEFKLPGEVIGRRE